MKIAVISSTGGVTIHTATLNRSFVESLAEQSLKRRPLGWTYDITLVHRYRFYVHVYNAQDVVQLPHTLIVTAATKEHFKLPITLAAMLARI